MQKTTTKTPPVMQTAAPYETIELVPPGGCISDLYGREYLPTAAYRVYKLKPGKEPKRPQSYGLLDPAE